MTVSSEDDQRRSIADAVGRKVQQAMLGGPENADPLDRDQLRLFNAAGFFTRGQIEHFAERIREADRLLDEVLSSPALGAGSPPAN